MSEKHSSKRKRTVTRRYNYIFFILSELNKHNGRLTSKVLSEKLYRKLIGHLHKKYDTREPNFVSMKGKIRLWGNFLEKRNYIKIYGKGICNKPFIFVLQPKGKNVLDLTQQK